MIAIQDGYAVVASDGLGTFPIVGYVRAGGNAVNVSPEQVAYITTGAPVPNGADAVVQIEDTERVPSAQEVTVLKAAKTGQDIRTVGSDIKLARSYICLGPIVANYW
jgi:gephyrin